MIHPGNIQLPLVLEKSLKFILSFNQSFGDKKVFRGNERLVATNKGDCLIGGYCVVSDTEGYSAGIDAVGARRPRSAPWRLVYPLRIVG